MSDNDDPVYVELGGDKRMREVLDERKRLSRIAPKGERELAYRKRAFMTAMLQSCICSYPLVEADTESKHERWCVSHQMLMSQHEADRIAGERAAGRMPP
jgi:hypothetical protein